MNISVSEHVLLSGTLPVRAHADRFFGTVKADGQQPRVTSLVCDEGDVVAIGLVGYETSTSAVLSTLWARDAVSFLVAPDIDWKGPRNLRRKPEGYKQFSTQLSNTKESHYIALPLSAHIREGILHPPDLPKPDEEDVAGEEKAPAQGKWVQARPMTLPTLDRVRYVLGNWGEEAPHRRSFLGHLYGMRVLFLHRDEEHADWPAIWAEELWKRGRMRKLIEPLPYALGMKVWKLSGDLEAWARLTGAGAREGWLPWQVTASPRAEQEAEELRLAFSH